MFVNVFTRKLFMTRVLMIVFAVLTLVGMTFVASPLFVLVHVSMFVFVFVSVLVRVPRITMPVLMRVGVSMPVFVIVSMLLLFFHVDLPNRIGSIRIMTILYTCRSIGACRQVRAYLFPSNRTQT
jgi:hypothetical protein